MSCEGQRSGDGSLWAACSLRLLQQVKLLLGDAPQRHLLDGHHPSRLRVQRLRDAVAIGRASGEQAAGGRCSTLYTSPLAPRPISSPRV